jgi:branched-chain amino acid transport system permease protein
MRLTKGLNGRRNPVLAVVTVLLFALPTLAQSSYLVYVATIALVYAMLAASWDILTGYSGLLSFGHAGFFGTGAYCAVLLVYHLGIPPWLALIFGAAGGGLLALAVGAITLRLRGPYLALMTLAAAQIVAILVLVNSDWTRGSLGLSGYSGLVDGGNYIAYYYIALVMTVGVVYGLYRLGESRYGLVLRALRDDELKVQTMGVNTARNKLIVFTVSGLVAGLAGAYFGFMVQVLTPDVFSPVAYSGLVIGMAMMGGMGTIFGPAVFALIYAAVSQLLQEFLGSGYDAAVLGILIVLAVIFMPRGLWPLLMESGSSAPLKRFRSLRPFIVRKKAKGDS